MLTVLSYPRTTIACCEEFVKTIYRVKLCEALCLLEIAESLSDRNARMVSAFRQSAGKAMDGLPKATTDESSHPL
jgi:hypothetical protein